METKQTRDIPRISVMLVDNSFCVGYYARMGFDYLNPMLFSGGRTDRDGMRDGSGNVAEVVSVVIYCYLHFL